MNLSTEFGCRKCDDSASTTAEMCTSGSSCQPNAAGSVMSNSKLSKQLQRKLNEFTMHWLEQNYQCQDGICLPRCLLYKHYIHYMRLHQENVKPIGAAAFGKLVRQKFPKISTRRLGTRGQSKYHYYGIAIRKCSPFYEDQKSVVLSQASSSSSSSSSLTHSITTTRSNKLEIIRAPSLCEEDANECTQVKCWNQVANVVYSEFHAPDSEHSQASLQQYPFHEYHRLDVPTHQSVGHATARSVHSSKTAKRRSKFLMLKSMVNQGDNSSPCGNGLGMGDDSLHRKFYKQNSCEPYQAVVRCSPSVNNSVQCSSPIATGPTPTSYTYFQNNFPSLHDFEPPSSISLSMLSTFLLMYQSHSHRILDTFQLANVEELEKTVTHFWNKMPAHLAPLLAHPYLSTVIETVDTLLYRTIEEFLSQLSMMPDMSNSFISDIEHILKEMKQWIGGSILGTHSRMKEIVTEYVISVDIEKIFTNGHLKADSGSVTTHTKVGSLLVSLVKCKVDAFDQFSLAVRKQLKFFKIAKNCRTRLSQAKCCTLMIDDLHEICPDNVEYACRLTLDRILTPNSYEGKLSQAEETCRLMDSSKDHRRSSVSLSLPANYTELVKHVHTQFGSLLALFQKTIDFEQILRWARSIVDLCVLKGKWSCLTSRSQALLYGFECYVMVVMRELTVNEAKSVKLWNLLFMCIKEYILLEVCRSIRYEKQNIQKSEHKSGSQLNGNYTMQDAGPTNLMVQTDEPPLLLSPSQCPLWSNVQANPTAHYRSEQTEANGSPMYSSYLDPTSHYGFYCQGTGNVCVSHNQNWYACVHSDSLYEDPVQYVQSTEPNDAQYDPYLAQAAFNNQQLANETSSTNQYINYGQQESNVKCQSQQPLQSPIPFNMIDSLASQTYSQLHPLELTTGPKWCDSKTIGQPERGVTYQTLYSTNCTPPANDLYDVEGSIACAAAHHGFNSAIFDGSQSTSTQPTSRLVTSEDGNIYTCLN